MSCTMQGWSCTRALRRSAHAVICTAHVHANLEAPVVGVLSDQVRQGQLQGGHRGEALLQREQQLRVHLRTVQAMLMPAAKPAAPTLVHHD